MAKDDVIVFDLETQHTFDEVGGRNFEALKISVCGFYSYLDDEYYCIEEHELHDFENRLIDAKRIIGYNSDRFDLPVIQPYLSLNVTDLPSLDLMLEIQKVLGFRIGLDSVAQATLGIGKTGNGLDAIDYFRNGEMEKLKSYCLQDVKVTKEIYDYGLAHGEIFYMSRDGQQKKKVEIDWDYYGASAKKENDPKQQYRLVF